MRSLSIVLILTITPLAVTATTFYAVPVADLYKESSLVVSGVVESGAVLPKDCGVSYTVRVDGRFKGSVAPGNLVTFRMQGPMQVGGRYFLFMNKSEEEFQPLMSTNSGEINTRAKYLQRCKDAWPPYTVNIWGNGALKVTGTYNDSVKSAVLFDNIVIVPPENLLTINLGPSDRYDNDRIETAMDLDMFTKYMGELSGDK